jgi:hypothetical protein
METPNLPAIRALRPAWNKGRIVGQKRPLAAVRRDSHRCGAASPEQSFEASASMALQMKASSAGLSCRSYPTL